MAKNIQELLREAKALKQQEKELKAKMKAKKQVIAKEYADNLSPEAKQKQIAEAQKILETAREKALEAKATFKQTMKAIKEDVAFAKEILDFVNYKQNHSLPKIKNAMVIEDNILTLTREGIKSITVDISKANWATTLKEELKKQGINGENRVADNIVYKAQQLIKANKEA